MPQRLIRNLLDYYLEKTTTNRWAIGGLHTTIYIMRQRPLTDEVEPYF